MPGGWMFGRCFLMGVLLQLGFLDQAGTIDEVAGGISS